ncbi:hypothetical protein [Paeniglutamicibacter terrestris]|uniref:Uncharacterized protein n=1 Tax=Paeniglutamicibacter terrestris TaxID=2723403 RepID=A0ABX1G3L1_9MICC|nr:hypothetical protein [Paeniglutamicibacter terrestris]ASN39256.1 hypothetical protein CGQ24_09665 [Arthrobacter sp. 7749]NKG20830.1 hypothetical protein [Paeniglutamicibacter terrestris]
MSHETHKKTAWSDELELWTPQEREWAELAAASMVFADASADAIGPALAEVRKSVAGSGQTPTELFGEPVLFGRTQGKTLRAPVTVLESGLPFPGVSSTIAGMLMGLGFLIFVLGIWLGFDEGWTIASFTVSVMILFPAVFVLVGIGLWGWVLRTRGRLRTAIVIWASTVLATGGLIATVASQETWNVPGPPNWVMAPVGAGLLILGLLSPHSKDRALEDDAQWDDERWFTHAQDLLRGRYLFSKAQAVAALREPREHRRLAGTHHTAAQEFGNVELFAAQLAPGVRTPLLRGVVLRRAGFSLVILCFGISIVSEFINEPVGAWLITRAVIWTLLAVGIIASWLPKRIREDIKEAGDLRKADAHTLSGDESRD